MISYPHILCVMHLLSLSLKLCTSEVRQDFRFQRVLSNEESGAYVIHSTKVTSMIQCSAICLTAAECQSFYFVKSTDYHSCTLLSSANKMAPSSFSSYYNNSLYLYNIKSCFTLGNCRKDGICKQKQNFEYQRYSLCGCLLSHENELCESETEVEVKPNNETLSKMCNPVPGLDMPEHRAQLHSSNFPRSYNNNENCNFTKTSISGDEEEYLVMFHTFKLEDDSACRRDYVRFDVEKKDGTTVQCGRYCGTKTPGPFKFKAVKITLIFRTDSSNTYKGFNLTYVVKTNGGFKSGDSDSPLI